MGAWHMDVPSDSYPHGADAIDPALDRKALRLRPEEELLHAEVVRAVLPTRRLTALEALMLLTDASRPEDIGQHGPAVAARVLPENWHHPALRLYEALFGRDALLTAWFVLEWFPELARTTIRRLAELQGEHRIGANEEEPGEIVHEYRLPDDPIAQALTKRRRWQWPYYGSIDATLLFIRLIARYVERFGPTLLQETITDEHGHNKTVQMALEVAVAWLQSKMNENPEGLVESRRLNKYGGNVNQAWKDSIDAYHHNDGTLANTDSGVASIEVQALAYDALLDVIRLLPDAAVVLKEKAERLKKTIFTVFWVGDKQGEYFALGTDRDPRGKLRPLRVRASNMGHVLNSRLLDGKDPVTVKMKETSVEALFATDMLNVSGIRTLSTRENRYRPNSYHNGSVWPWDTFYISLGLERQGYHQLAKDLWQRLDYVFKATKKFPEFVSGEDTPEPIVPNCLVEVRDTKYHFKHFTEQPPQEIQAWSVATAVALTSLLGVRE